jgi:hypothetical protein
MKVKFADENLYLSDQQRDKASECHGLILHFENLK